MEILKFEQGSEAWHQARCGRITGTKFKEIMASESTAAFQNVVAQLAGEIMLGSLDEPETYQNEIMQRGSMLEPIARKSYEEITGYKVQEIGMCLMDEYEESVGYSADGLVENEGQIEIKCPLIKNHLKYLIEGKLPNEYKWQVQGGLLVTGREWCDFVSFYPDLKPFILRVKPDLEMHKELKEKIDTVISLVKDKIKSYKEYDYEQFN